MIVNKQQMELMNLRKRVVLQREEIKRMTEYARQLEKQLEELRRQHEAFR